MIAAEGVSHHGGSAASGQDGEIIRSLFFVFARKQRNNAKCNMAAEMVTENRAGK